jgi:hypothetical protein
MHYTTPDGPLGVSSRRGYVRPSGRRRALISFRGASRGGVCLLPPKKFPDSRDGVLPLLPARRALAGTPGERTGLFVCVVPPSWWGLVFGGQLSSLPAPARGGSRFRPPPGGRKGLPRTVRRSRASPVAPCHTRAPARARSWFYGGMTGGRLYPLRKNRGNCSTQRCVWRTARAPPVGERRNAGPRLPPRGPQRENCGLS